MKRVAWYVVLVLLTLTALVVLWQFREAAMLFVLSLAVGAAVRPPIDYLAERRVPRSLAISVDLWSGGGMLVLLFYVISGALAVEVQRAVDNLSTLYDHISTGWPAHGLLGQLIAQHLPPTGTLFEDLADQREQS